MAGVDSDVLSEFPIPGVEEADLDHVPGARAGVRVVVEKIDPETGESVLSTVDLTGELAKGEHSPEGHVRKGGRLYVYPVGSDGYDASHTSTIKQIDRMTDGSYWLQTQNSTYRLIMEVGLEESRTQVGGQHGRFRRLIGWLFGHGSAP